MYSMGLIAYNKKLKINYTRKIIHFSMFFLPFLIYEIFEITDVYQKGVSSFFTSLIIFLFLSKQIRAKIKIFEIMFLSIDRPEDRPNTYWWLVTQAIAGYSILIFFFYLFEVFDIKPHLIYITILLTTIGDGLAEPIGVAYGKHKYESKGFFSKKKFERSIEGSSVVFITAIILIIFFKDNFSTNQLIVTLLTYPILVTLTEAKSPHTWDTPFLFLSGNICMILITQFIL